MKKTVIMILAASVLLSVSCMKEELSQSGMSGLTFTATLPEDDATKTVLGTDGHSVTWGDQDRIMTLYNESGWQKSWSRVTSVSEDGRTAVFAGSSDQMVWAIYPNYFTASESVYTYGSCDNNTVNITLKNSPTKTKFEDAHIMMAKADGSNLPFKNVTGIFRIDLTEEVTAAVKEIRIYGDGIAGELSMIWNGVGFDVAPVGEGQKHIDINCYTGETAKYVAVRPGTYPAGNISFIFYSGDGVMLSKSTYDKELTVTPGMIVNWGNIYRDHLDNLAMLPWDLSSKISTLAGGISNITAVEFITNVPGEQGPLETRINDSYPGPEIYASFLHGTVTLRTAAPKMYKRAWSETFENFSKLETVTGLKNIDFTGETSFDDMFYGTALKSFDFTELNSTSSLTNLGDMFSHSGVKTVNMAGVDLGNVTRMGYMFYDCDNLTYVDMENANLANLNSLYMTFTSCAKLEKVNMKNVDLRKVTTMYEMFKSCTALTDIYTTGVRTRDVTDLHEMFDYCTSLTSIDLRWLNTENVTDMGYMFRGCELLSSVDLSSFNTGKVESFGQMFQNCKVLQNVDLSSFTAESATSLSQMFDGCLCVKSITFGKFVTSNVRAFNYMFNDCGSLTSLDLSSFDTSSAVSFEYMFTDCSKLTALDLSSFHTPSLTDCEVMFWGCESLTSLDLSNFVTTDKTDMTRMFDYTGKLAYLSLGKDFVLNSSDPFGYVLIGSRNKESEYYASIRCSDYTWSQIEDKLGASISHYQHIEIPLAEFPATFVLRPFFKQIGDKIGGNDYIKTITFLADCSTSYSGEVVMNEGVGEYRIYGSVDASGNVIIRTPGPGFKLNADSRYFFSSNSTKTGGNKFSGLTQINGMNLLNTGSVTDMSGFFSGCSSLTTVDLTNFSTHSVSNFNNMFLNCSNLNELDFSSFSVDSTPNCSSMFKNCTSLVSLDLSSFNGEVGSMGSMFYGCTKLASLVLGKDMMYTSAGGTIFRGMGSGNTTAAYYTTICCNSGIWSILQLQEEDNITHYHWIPAE